MEEKQTFWKKLGAFVGGRGFYALLGLCLVIIAASAWTLFSSLQQPDGTGEVYYAGEDSAAVTVTPAPTPAPTPRATAPAVREKTEEDIPVLMPETEPEPEPAEETAEEVQQPDEEAIEEVNTAPEGWIWPVAGEIVLEYAPDYLVWNMTMADWRTHEGVDLAAAMGTRVLAVSAGTVTAVGEDDLLGTFVEVDHGEGITSLYANLAATPAVTAGDAVKMGDVIGSVGDTALGETGEEAHLHFSMTCDGESADPAEYLPQR